MLKGKGNFKQTKQTFLQIVDVFFEDIYCIVMILYSLETFFILLKAPGFRNFFVSLYLYRIFTIESFINLLIFCYPLRLALIIYTAKTFCLDELSTNLSDNFFKVNLTNIFKSSQ